MWNIKINKDARRYVQRKEQALIGIKFVLLIEIY